MKALTVAALLASGASAAPRLVPAAASPAPSHELAGAHSGGPYWFKTYSVSPYAEIWNAELALNDFDHDLSKAVAAIEKNGGVLAQPLANFVSSAKDKTQQVDFSVPMKNEKALLKSLRALGVMADPVVRSRSAPVPLDEVRAKIAVLMKEKTDRAADLARVPAAAAAEEEILEHLLMVEELSERVVARARVNMLVRQK